MAGNLVRMGIEDFLYREADLLDSWRLDEWLDLFTGEARYLVPAGSLPNDASPESSLFYIADDIVLLRERVARLAKRSAHAEWPHSKTRHMITNVQFQPHSSGYGFLVSCAFLTHRYRAGDVSTFIGSSRYHLLPKDASYLIQEKRCQLDFDNLHDQGRISILL